MLFVFRWVIQALRRFGRPPPQPAAVDGFSYSQASGFRPSWTWDALSESDWNDASGAGGHSREYVPLLSTDGGATYRSGPAQTDVSYTGQAAAVGTRVRLAVYAINRNGFASFSESPVETIVSEAGSGFAWTPSWTERANANGEIAITFNAPHNWGDSGAGARTGHRQYLVYVNRNGADPTFANAAVADVDVDSSSASTFTYTARGLRLGDAIQIRVRMVGRRSYANGAAVSPTYTYQRLMRLGHQTMRLSNRLMRLD